MPFIPDECVYMVLFLLLVDQFERLIKQVHKFEFLGFH